jgi:site-specific DNA-methyltransferase (adenine-specific)
MATPYYQDEMVTLYHGDCREITEWLSADVIVTDPPWGRQWKQGRIRKRGHNSEPIAGISGDGETALRDLIFEMWGSRRVISFGDLMLPPPASTKQVLVYEKPTDAGMRGAIAGFRRDVEGIYLINSWPSGIGGRTSIVATNARSVGTCIAKKYGHPHAKPLDVMAQLISVTTGSIADPFAGSGSTLVAAKLDGRHAVGVELEEQYCEITARRLSQEPLPFPAMSAEDRAAIVQDALFERTEDARSGS